MSRVGPVGRDLAALAVLVACLDVASLLPVVRSSPIRALFGLAVALFVPGYAILAALFPRDTSPVVDRAGLSVGVSVVVTITVGFALGVTPIGLGRDTTVGALSGVAFVAIGVATVRRTRADHPTTRSHDTTEQHASTDLATVITDAPAALTRSPVTNGLIALALVGTTAAIVALLLGPAGSVPTEVYFAGNATTVQVENGSTATAVQADGSLPVAVVNHADHAREYTLVVSLQRVADGTRSRSVPVNVTEERELRRIHNTVGADGEWVARPTIDPKNTTGDRLDPRDGTGGRLVVRVYEGNSTGDPLHSLHLWLSPDDGSSRSTAETKQGNRP
jgi:uncharacterized membrane protein